MKKIMICFLALVMTLNLCIAYTEKPVYAETTEDGNYEYQVLDDGTIEIMNYLGKESVVTIPGKIEGKTVTSIGAFAFVSNQNLEKVTIPEGVTCIGNDAFRHCYSLTDVTIPGSVTDIMDNAFFNCIDLTKVTIPEGVINIGYEAFDACINLEEVTIPASVADIKDGAFSRCDSLTAIQASPENECYMSKEGVLFDKGMTKLVAYPAGKPQDTYSIPSGVTQVGDYAFAGCVNLTEMIIPGSIDKVGNGLFYECEKLEKVDILDGVASIGYDAFYFCSSLKEVTIPDSITDIERWAFADCSNLTRVTIPGSVESIGGYAFGRCSSLAEVIIKEGVTYIEQEAFTDCSSLAEVTIPKSVISIGDYVFGKCGSLARISVSPENENYSSEDGVLFDKEKTELVKYPAKKAQAVYSILESVVSIDSYAFEDCQDLTEVTIPESVTSIGEYVFEGCKNLTEIKVSPESESYSSEDGVLFDKEKKELIRYPEGKTQEVYYVLEGVTNIVRDAFAGCESLTEVTIPGSVANVDSWAFDQCNNLRIITLECSQVPADQSDWSGIWNIMYSQLDLEAVYVPDESYDAYKEAWPDLPDGVLRKISEKDTPAPKPPVYGDPDGDCVVGVTDALMILKYVANSFDLSSEQMQVSNVDGDNAVTVNDALCVLKMVAGSLTEFPVEG